MYIKNKIIFIKKYLSTSFLIISIAMLFIIIWKILQKKENDLLITRIPNFSFITLNNGYFTNSKKEFYDRVILNYFSPNCEHCQYMAKSYLANKEQLKDATILMVTVADSTSVAKFSKEYQLNTMPNIALLRDTKYQFEKIFGTSVVPSFFIYQNNKLIKKIIGETKIENLLAP